MSFPAYQAFHGEINSQTGKDIRRGFVRWRVYMHLVHCPVLNFVTPVEVKVTGLSSTLKMGPRKVIDALDWLASTGYLVEHGRHERRVRSLTLAWELQPRNAA